MLRPSEDTEDWFNLFVLHQNHTKRGTTNYIPEAILHSFLDLVIWGHEHECLINPQPSSDNSFHVMQPGKNLQAKVFRIAWLGALIIRIWY